MNSGSTGHTLSLLLYNLVKTDNELSHEVYHQIIDRAIGAWGDISEFYGPLGTPNSHNMNIFSTGITLDALLMYAQKYGL